MKTVTYDRVNLTDGFLFEKQELNRKVTIDAVYDRFNETGRVGAFDFSWKEGDEKKPHIYWDSDIAKWMEGAAYILRKHPTPALEEKVDALVAKIQANQCSDGYFNIYYTVCEPEGRFQNRDMHELYCAGHLMEAAVAYAETTGKTDFLACMEKYADYIAKVFAEEKSAKFFTPGHEEIELALVRMYRYTKKKKYLDLAAYFINQRGVDQSENFRGVYDQSHLPVREQTEALGHAVRAVYLYTGMAYLAAETGDESLVAACKTLWENITARKMYVTGGIGSTREGEAFDKAYNLPNNTAYTETCAGIGLIFFANAMLALENDSRYADVIERALYNGVLSGLSFDGRSFFYENPLEITLSERFDSAQFADVYKNRANKMPITQRVECFRCSCCPPNINRLLASLGNYVYGVEDERLYVNQFVSSKLAEGGISCTQVTRYPLDGAVELTVSGAKQIAVRIPDWCDSVSINKPYRVEKGYAVMENDGGVIRVCFDMTPTAYYADPRVSHDLHRLCIARGPVVYCAEGVDNSGLLHGYLVCEPMVCREVEGKFGLPDLLVECRAVERAANRLYSKQPPKVGAAELRLIPYHAFANRGESDMTVWLNRDRV